MNENLPTNVQLDTNANGSVTFATDVVAKIAGVAATEVEGVATMYSGATGLADILPLRKQPARTLTKGVRVELNENNVYVHLTIVVEYGSPIPEVAQTIQENVKKNIETMSGLHVTDVDVHVQGLSFERENRASADLEMQQRLMLQKGAASGEAAREASKANAEPVKNEPAKSEPEEPAKPEAESAKPEEAAQPAEEKPEEDDDLFTDNFEEEFGDKLEEEPAPAKEEEPNP